MKFLIVKGRDNVRTPMQWNSSENAGFTTGTSWLKVNENYKVINAEDTLVDKNSIFYYYKDLVKFRKENDIVVYRDYKLLLEKDE